MEDKYPMIFPRFPGHIFIKSHDIFNLFIKQKRGPNQGSKTPDLQEHSLKIYKQYHKSKIVMRAKHTILMKHILW